MDDFARLGKHGARLKELRRRVRSRVAGEVVVDGRRLVEDLVRWEVALRELYLTPELAASAEARTWVEHASSAFVLDAELLGSVAPTRNPQGVLAVAAEPAWPPWPARAGLALYLDGVQDPGNLGAIVRSAAALGAAAVLLSPGSVDPFHPAAVRGSAGAVFRLPVERELPLERALSRIREHRGEVWATGPDGVPVGEWRPREPGLLLLGAEGAGLSDQAVAAADNTVTIPLDRQVESLNVAVAAGILLDRWRSLHS